MPEYKLSEIAARLGLTLQGEDIAVTGLNTLEAAGPRELSFLANPKYLPFLKDTSAGAVIIDEAHASGVKRALISKSPYLDFGRALALFARREGCLSGVSPEAYVHPEAQLGESCTVYPFAFIGARAKLGKGCRIFSGAYVGEDASLGDNCTLYPNAVILSRVELGDGCELHPGAVLGSDGFGFARQPQGGIQPIPQAGFVRLGKGVSVGANSTIDRGALGPTVIGDESKIDNQVQIGHNVAVGRENIIVAQSGIAGSTKVGDRVTLAAQAGISGHLSIGDDALIGPKSGVAKNVPAGFSGGGSPLVDAQTFMRTLTVMPRLPELFKRVGKLEKELGKLRENEE